MFESAETAIETVNAEYVVHSDLDQEFDLTVFFEPALQDSDPETVDVSRGRHFRSTIKRGQALAALGEPPFDVAEVTDHLTNIANNQSTTASRKAINLDYCDDLYALTALALEIETQYPTTPIEDAFDYLQVAVEDVVSDDLTKGIESICRAGKELYRTAVVVRRADQLFAVLSKIDEPEFGSTEATIGENLEKAIAERDTELIDTAAEQLSSVIDSTWTRDDLLDCSHCEFEVLVADLWQEEGFDARATKYVQDYNIDVIAESEDTRELIQAKQYGPDNTVGVKTVQRTAGLLVEFDADSVAVVTSSGFSKNARDSAERMSEDVRLVDSEQLCHLLTRSQLVPPLQ